MKLRYRTSFYTLIQLVSILFLSTLAQSQARQAPTTTGSPLRLEVGSARPRGSERVVQVILSNVSADRADLANYRLVYREKNKKSFSIYCYSSKGKPIEVAPEQPLPLTELLGTEMLPTEKGSDTTLTLILMPGKGVSHAELALSIEDAQGNSVSEPLSMTWRAKPFWTTQKILAGGAVLASAVLGGLIWYFSRNQPSAGPDPDLSESSKKGCPQRKHTQPDPPQDTDKGKELVGHQQGRVLSNERSFPANPSELSTPQSQPDPLGQQSDNPTPQLHSFARSTFSPEEPPLSNRADANTAPKLVRAQSWPSLPKADATSRLARCASLESHLSVTLQPQPAQSPSTEDAATASPQGNASSPRYPETGTSSPQRDPSPSTEAAATASPQGNASSPRKFITYTHILNLEDALDRTSQDDVDDLADSEDCVPVNTAKEQEDIIKLGLALLKNVYTLSRDLDCELCLEGVCNIIDCLYLMAQAKGPACTTYVLDDSEEKLFDALRSARAAQYFTDPILSRQELAQEIRFVRSTQTKKDQSNQYRIPLPNSATLHTAMQCLRFFSFTGPDGKKKLSLKLEQQHDVTISNCSISAYKHLVSTVRRASGMANGDDAYRKGEEVTFTLKDLGISTPEQNAIWNDVRKGLEIAIDDKPIAPQPFEDANPTGSTEEASKKQFLDQLEKAIPEDLHEGLFPLLNQRLREMSIKYLSSHNDKRLLSVGHIVLKQKSISEGREARPILVQIQKITSIENRQKINVNIDGDVITLTTPLRAKVEFTDQTNQSQKASTNLIFNFTVPLKLAACKRGEKIHELPDATVYTIKCEDANVQQCYLEQAEAETRENIWGDVDREKVQLIINDVSIAPQPFKDTSSTSITKEDSKAKFFSELKEAIPEDLHKSLFPLLTQTMGLMSRNYAFFHAKNDLLWQVYEAVWLKKDCTSGLLTGSKYQMGLLGVGDDNIIINVRINQGTITLTTQLKAPIQITTQIDQSKETVSLSLNFTIPLALEACKSDEEINHLPNATAYTIELQDASQQSLLEAAYKDCIAGAKAATA